MVALSLAAAASSQSPKAQFLNIPCDGHTDVSPQINAALANAKDAITALPAGRCLASSTLLIPAHTGIQGQGIGKTIISFASNTGHPAISITGPDASLSHITIDAGASEAGPRGSDGVRAQATAGNASIHDVEVFHAADNGIETNASQTQIYANMVHDNYTNGIYVIGTPARPVSGVSIRDNYVANNSKGNAKWDGIDSDPSTFKTLITANLLVGNDIILFDSGHATGGSGGHVISGNRVFNSHENCIDIAGQEQDITVTANVCENIVGYGVLLNVNTPFGEQKMSNITISGNRVNKATSVPIWVMAPRGAHGPSGVKISNNLFD